MPTPVGNLEDMTFRAVEVLKQVDLILAEDTRTTSVLLKHYGISRPTEAHHKFNEHARVRPVCEKILSGTGRTSHWSRTPVRRASPTPDSCSPGHARMRA